MTGPSITPTSFLCNSVEKLIIDSDCAMGSQSGDVDDGFAVHYALRKFPLEKVLFSAVGGNTSAKKSNRNINRIQALVNPGSSPCLLGLDPGAKSNFCLPSKSMNVLALGPLTNVRSWIRQSPGSVKKVFLTAGRIKTSGNLPPIWPIEFNATKDRGSFLEVCESNVAITAVPLDVAYNLRLTNFEWKKLVDQNFVFLKKSSQRWRNRARLIKFRSWFPVWDLVSTVAVVRPELFNFENANMHIFANGLVLFDEKGIALTPHDRSKAKLSRPATIVTDFDPREIWNEFFKI
jgi:inosine-uridine nucleoside N-ribohydrolase